MPELPLTAAMRAAVSGFMQASRREPLLAALAELEERAALVPDLERRITVLERKLTTQASAPTNAS